MIYRRNKIFYMDFQVNKKRVYRSCRTSDRTEARIVEMEAKIQALRSTK
jgi:hypothetical protein